MLIKGTKKTGFARSKYAPLIKLLIVAGSVIAVAALVIFVGIPLLNGEDLSQQQSPQYVENEFQTPNEESRNDQPEDLSLLQREAIIQYNTINDAFMYGNEIVFSTASVEGTTLTINP